MSLRKKAIISGAIAVPILLGAFNEDVRTSTKDFLNKTFENVVEGHYTLYAHNEQDLKEVLIRDQANPNYSDISEANYFTVFDLDADDVFFVKVGPNDEYVYVPIPEGQESRYRDSLELHKEYVAGPRFHAVSRTTSESKEVQEIIDSWQKLSLDEPELSEQ